MKKKRLIGIIVIVLIFLFSGSIIIAQRVYDESTQNIIDSAQKAVNNKTVIAIVEGKEIYQEMIDFYAEGEKISKKNITQNTDESAEDLEVDKEKILQEEIRKIVVLAEAEKQGLAVSYEEAEEYTMTNYNAAKEENGQTYKILLDYMEAMKLTEKQYLELCISSDQKKLTRAKLYEKFAEDKEGTYEDKVAEYEKYVDSLIKKAEIEYK